LAIARSSIGRWAAFPRSPRDSGLPVNVVQVHAVFPILMLAMFAALLLTCGPALLEPTRLSRAILIGLTIFWTLRLLMQWFFYSPEIWRGHRFNTAMHWVLSLTWIYVSAVFAAALASVGFVR
jgi:hypothetical protein